MTGRGGFWPRLAGGVVLALVLAALGTNVLQFEGLRAVVRLFVIVLCCALVGVGYVVLADWAIRRLRSGRWK